MAVRGGEVGDDGWVGGRVGKEGDRMRDEPRETRADLLPPLPSFPTSSSPSHDKLDTS